MDSFGYQPKGKAKGKGKGNDGGKGTSKEKGKGKGKTGKGKGTSAESRCNLCNRQGQWARECWFKESKRGADGKAIVTREDQEKVRKTHVDDVGVEEWPDDESGWETVETYSLGLYMPIRLAMSPRSWRRPR